MNDDVCWKRKKSRHNEIIGRINEKPWNHKQNWLNPMYNPWRGNICNLWNYMILIDCYGDSESDTIWFQLLLLDMETGYKIWIIFAIYASFAYVQHKRNYLIAWWRDNIPWEEKWGFLQCHDSYIASLTFLVRIRSLLLKKTLAFIIIRNTSAEIEEARSYCGQWKNQQLQQCIFQEGLCTYSYLLKN